jgi:hypothetical protein
LNATAPMWAGFIAMVTGFSPLTLLCRPKQEGAA